MASLAANQPIMEGTLEADLAIPPTCLLSARNSFPISLLFDGQVNN